MSANTSTIKALLDQSVKKVWEAKTLEEFLNTTHDKWASGNATQDANILPQLISQRILWPVLVNYNKRITFLYVTPTAHPAEISLAVRHRSYLAYFTALHLWGLTKTVPKLIYTNLEQFKQRQGEKPKLEQLNVDKAFSHPMRQSNQVAEFEFAETKYKTLFLNGTKFERLGVTTIISNGRELPVTDIERTLIDALVRPLYCGGVDEVLNAFQEAKGRYSVKRLLSYLKKMDFIYPYHQLLGFYLEQTGSPEKNLKQIEKMVMPIDFYLTYEMRKKKYSTRWRVYYPAELDLEL